MPDNSVPSITVLILSFNGKHHLVQHLDSVLATDYDNFRVTVIDNGSTDGSLEFLEEKYRQIEVVRHKHNYGFAVAYNKVINSIDTEYFVLLNNDVSVDPDWLKILVSHAKGKETAALTPKMLFYHNKRRINAAGGNCDLYGTGWNRGNNEIDNGQYDKLEEAFYGNGAALLVSKQAWRDVGPFDERYFMYGEDLDWCWRARLKGYKILYVPSSKVYHCWLGSKGSVFYFLERHCLSNVLKNYSLKTLFKITPKYLAIRLLKTFWVLKNAGCCDKLSVLKAVWWNMKNLMKTWEKRMQIQTSRSVPDADIQRLMLKNSFELLLGLKKTSHPIMKAVWRDY